MSDQQYHLSARVSIYADVKDVKEAETQIERLTRSIEELDDAYQENVASQENVREAMVKLHKEGREGSEEWEGLHKDLDRLSTTMLEMREAMIGYASEMEGAEEATDQQRQSSQRLATEMEDLAEQQQNSNDIARSSKDRLEHVNQAAKQTAISVERLKNETRQDIVQRKAHNEVLIKEAVHLERVKKEGQFLGVAMGDMRKSLVQALSIGGVAGLVFKGISLIEDGLRSAIEATKEFQKQATITFTDLEEEIARTQAQVEGFDYTMGEAYDNIIEVSREMKRGPLEAQETYRKLLNLGLDQEQAFKAMEASSKAARVANSELLEVAVTATNTFNAYGGELYTVSEVLDYFAFITQNSNLEFSDLVTNMTKIISPAAEAGIKLDEVAGAMITMNRQGDDMQEIGELLGLLFTQLNIPTTQLGETFKDAAGVAFPRFIQQGGTLVEGLILLDDHIDELDITTQEAVIGLSKFFRDAQAGRGVVEIIGRHMDEMAENTANAGESLGALDEQYGFFIDTLYIANEELDAQREAAYAVEGSLTKGLAMSLVKAKTAWFGFVEGASAAIDVQKDIGSALEDTNNILDNVWNKLMLQQLAWQTAYDSGLRGVELGAQQYKNEKLIVQILTENKDLYLDEVEAALDQVLLTAERLETEEAINYERRERMALDGQGAQNAAQFQEDELAAQKEEVALAEEEAEIELRLELIAEHKLEIEEKIVGILERQNTALMKQYEASKPYIDAISQLQVEIADEEDLAILDELNAKLKEAGENMEKYFKNQLISSMMSAHGYSEATIDLAVSLGLLTKEAGETQKEFIGIGTEVDKLAESDPFVQFSTAEQKSAFDDVVEGVATAQQAIDEFDPLAWKKDTPMGIIRAEEEYFNMPITVEMPTEDEQRLEQIEERVYQLVGPEEPHEVDIGAEDKFKYIYEDLDTLHDHLLEITADYKINIIVETIYKDGYVDPGTVSKVPLARGGDFIVPAGFNNDDYILGVTSGERVTVTTPGQSLGNDTGGVTVALTNYFSAGVYDQQTVATGVKDGMYKALEELGLT